MNVSITLTEDEAHDAAGIQYVMEHVGGQQCFQIAAELAYLRSILYAARRERPRLPRLTQQQVNRYPGGARTVTFHTPRPRLELTP